MVLKIAYRALLSRNFLNIFKTPPHPNLARWAYNSTVSNILIEMKVTFYHRLDICGTPIKTEHRCIGVQLQRLIILE